MAYAASISKSRISGGNALAASAPHEPNGSRECAPDDKLRDMRDQSTPHISALRSCANLRNGS
jgi:hypothetical protein